MKIDTFNTLISVVKMLQDEKRATKSPYIIVAMPEDKDAAAVTISADAFSVLHMYSSLTISLLKLLRKDFSDAEVDKLFSAVVEFAISKALAEDDGDDFSEEDGYCTYVDDKGFVRDAVSVEIATEVISTGEDPFAEDFLTLKNGEKYEIILSFINKSSGINFIVFTNDEVTADGTIKNYVGKAIPAISSNTIFPVNDNERYFVMRKYHEWINEDANV